MTTHTTTVTLCDHCPARAVTFWPNHHPEGWYVVRSGHTGPTKDACSVVCRNLLVDATPDAQWTDHARFTTSPRKMDTRWSDAEGRPIDDGRKVPE